MVPTQPLACRILAMVVRCHYSPDSPAGTEPYSRAGGKRRPQRGNTRNHNPDRSADSALLRPRAQRGSASCRKCALRRVGHGNRRRNFRPDRQRTNGNLARPAFRRLAQSHERNHGHGSARLLSGHDGQGNLPLHATRSLLSSFVRHTNGDERRISFCRSLVGSAVCRGRSPSCKRYMGRLLAERNAALKQIAESGDWRSCPGMAEAT